MQNTGSPTVILAKTIKGYGMGKTGESVNTTHQQKKLDEEDLLYYRDRFKVPLTDKQVKNVEYYKPGYPRWFTALCGAATISGARDHLHRTRIAGRPLHWRNKASNSRDWAPDSGSALHREQHQGQGRHPNW